MTNKEIFVMRHGQSIYNNISRQLKELTPAGLYDTNLSIAGTAEVSEVRHVIKSLHIDCIVCSPLQRAIQTSLLLNVNVPIHITHLCRERISCDGDYGSDKELLTKLYPTLDFSNLPEHTWWLEETTEQLQQRCVEFMNYIKHMNHKRILIVSHYGFLLKLTGRELKNCDLLPYVRAVVYNDIYINIDCATKYYSKWGESLAREPETFNIFKKFLMRDKPYFDIGACYGQTLLYGSCLSKHAYGIEPDPIAFRDLQLNVNANNFINTTIINKALSNTNNNISFGCKGTWGNSKSTMLMTPKLTSIVEVESTTIDSLLLQFPELADCNFIKMDIEGGEKIVIPAMQNYLRMYGPTLYISLHTKWGLISHDDTVEILNILYDIYTYVYHRDMNRTLCKEEILDSQMEPIIFSNKQLLKS